MSDGISYAPVSPENCRDWFVYLRSLNGLQQADYQGWRSIADYLALLDRRTAQNVVAADSLCQRARAGRRLVGADRSTTRKSNIMRREIERAMDAGAVGISTGLDYIAAVLRHDRRTGRSLLGHASLARAVRDARALQERHARRRARSRRDRQARRGAGAYLAPEGRLSGRGRRDSGLRRSSRGARSRFLVRHLPVLARLDDASYLLPYEVWEDGPLAACRQAARSGGARAIGDAVGVFQRAARQDRAGLDGHARTTPAIKAKASPQYAAATGRRPAEALVHLLIEEQLAALSVLHTGDDEWIEPFLQHPKFMLGTDGIYFADGRVHPRVYGSAPQDSRAAGARPQAVFAGRGRAQDDRRSRRAVWAGRPRRRSARERLPTWSCSTRAPWPIGPRTTIRISFRSASSG